MSNQKNNGNNNDPNKATTSVTTQATGASGGDTVLDLRTSEQLGKGEYKLIRKLSKAKYDIKTKLVAHNKSHNTNIHQNNIPQYNDIKHNMGVRLSTMTDLNEESRDSMTMSDISGMNQLRNLNSSQTIHTIADRESYVTSQTEHGDEASWIKYVGQNDRTLN